MARAVTPDLVVEVAGEIMPRPFTWGACDCCSAACDVYRELWGIDPLATYRGKYSTMGQAYRRILLLGGPRRAVELLMNKSGLAECEPTIGCLGLAEGGRSMLICVTPGLWLGKSIDGMVTVGHSEKCWKHA